MKSKIRLVFNNVAEIVGEERLGLLSLTDEEQTMELLIPCEREIKEQLTLRLKSRTVTFARSVVADGTRQHRCQFRNHYRRYH